jgi:hypothetical protein
MTRKFKILPWQSVSIRKNIKKKKDPVIKWRVNQGLLDGRWTGVRGKPTLLINGIRLRDRSLKGFQAAIDK